MGHFLWCVCVRFSPSPLLPFPVCNWYHLLLVSFLACSTAGRANWPQPGSAQGSLEVQGHCMRSTCLQIHWTHYNREQEHTNTCTAQEKVSEVVSSHTYAFTSIMWQLAQYTRTTHTWHPCRFWLLGGMSIWMLARAWSPCTASEGRSSTAQTLLYLYPVQIWQFKYTKGHKVTISPRHVHSK